LSYVDPCFVLKVTKLRKTGLPQQQQQLSAYASVRPPLLWMGVHVGVDSTL